MFAIGAMLASVGTAQAADPVGYVNNGAGVCRDTSGKHSAWAWASGDQAVAKALCDSDANCQAIWLHGGQHQIFCGGISASGVCTSAGQSDYDVSSVPVGSGSQALNPCYVKVAVYNTINEEYCDEDAIAAYMGVLDAAGQQTCGMLFQALLIDDTVDLCPCSLLVSKEHIDNNLSDKIKNCKIRNKSGQPVLVDEWASCPRGPAPCTVDGDDVYKCSDSACGKFNGGNWDTVSADAVTGTAKADGDEFTTTHGAWTVASDKLTLQRTGSTRSTESFVYSCKCD